MRSQTRCSKAKSTSSQSLVKSKKASPGARTLPHRKASVKKNSANNNQAPGKKGPGEKRTSYLSDQRFAGYKLGRQAADLDAVETAEEPVYDSSANPLATPLPFSDPQWDTLKKRQLLRSRQESLDAQFGPLTPQSTYQWTHLAHTMSKLDSYSVIELSGPDSTKVLHSLTTQDITNYALHSYPTLVESTLTSQQRHPTHINTTSTTAAFLTPKGRMNYTALISIAQTPALSDLSILPTSNQQSQVIKKTNQLELAMKINAAYQIIVPKSVAGNLVKHIKENSLRLKSKLQIRPDLSVYSVISSIDPSLAAQPIDDAQAPFMTQMEKIAPPFELDLDANPTFTALTPSQNDPALEHPITIMADPRPLPKHIAHHYIIAPSSRPLHSTLLHPRKNSILSLPTPNESELDEQTSLNQNSSAEAISQSPYTFTHEVVHDVFSTLYSLPNNTNGIQPGKSLPLEYNMDLGNGVSYNKGCYLGQELTSRTHHRGEIRKRAVPAFFIPLDVSSAADLKQSLQYGYGLYKRIGPQMLKEIASLNHQFDDCDVDLDLSQDEPNGEDESTNTQAGQQSQHQQQTQMTDSIPKRIFNYDLFNGSSLELVATSEMPENSTNDTVLDSKLPSPDSPIFNTIKMLMQQQALLNDIKNDTEESAVDTREYTPQQGDGVHLYDLSQHFTKPKGDQQVVDSMQLTFEQSKIAVKDDVGSVLFSPEISNVGTIQFRTDFFTKSFNVGQISLPPTFVVTRKRQKQQQKQQSQDGTPEQLPAVEEVVPVSTYSGEVWQCIPICPEYVEKDVFAKFESELLASSTQAV